MSQKEARSPQQSNPPEREKGRDKDFINSGHYILPTMPNGSKHTHWLNFVHCESNWCLLSRRTSSPCLEAMVLKKSTWCLATSIEYRPMEGLQEGLSQKKLDHGAGRS